MTPASKTQEHTPDAIEPDREDLDNDDEPDFDEEIDDALEPSDADAASLSETDTPSLPARLDPPESRLPAFVTASSKEVRVRDPLPVSYTHLTLPTKRIV